MKYRLVQKWYTHIDAYAYYISIPNILISFTFTGFLSIQSILLVLWKYSLMSLLSREDASFLAVLWLVRLRDSENQVSMLSNVVHRLSGFVSLR